MSYCAVMEFGRLAGRVAVVTGGGDGIGEGVVRRFAAEGARVLIAERDAAAGRRVADAVTAEFGADVVALTVDVSVRDQVDAMVASAVDRWGTIDILVNNAGILRDRVLVNMTEEEWDSVIAVHLKGTFGPSRWAGAYWRERSKAGLPTNGRIINTTSVSGIYGNPGQTNYGAAKAGIAAFTNIAALELSRYGVTVNAVAPVALTRMTEGLGPAPETDEEREMRSPRWIAPIVTWLASEESADVTGRVFEASGQTLAIAEGWVRGPRTAPIEDPTKLGPVVAELLSQARKNSGMNGEPGGWPQPR